VVSVGCRYRPAKAGKFTGDGDGAEGAALAALGVEPYPAAVQAFAGRAMRSHRRTEAVLPGSSTPLRGVRR
jgi:hypothetical protein